MIVHVKQGKLEGLKEKSILTGNEYFSFLGVPYAKPPIGDLRFQPPSPAEKWDGTYEAKNDHKICIQCKQLEEHLDELQGSEDCLYLNIYTTDLNPQRAKAVMVFIHGGAFLTGSGSTDSHSPDYLINYDIVLVTMNYRLHVFGFLNLGIPECEGNFGLKDQLMALQWINENIRQFGGDPKNVTIFGESAGSSSVHWHIISPLSRKKELFHKAILQSGTALNSWAFVHNPTDMAFLIGSRLGFEGDNPLKLLNYMKQQPAEKLTAATFDLYFDGMNYTGEHPPFGFVPSIETVKKNAFIPEMPMNLIKTAQPLPVIAGANDREGLIVIGLATEALLHKYNENFALFFKHRFNAILSQAQIACIVSKVRQHYFENKPIGGPDTFEQLVDAFSDLICLQFYDSFEFVANSSDSQFYVYEFTFDGELNVFKSTFLRNMPPIRGAAHADELGYLFYQRLQLPSLSVRPGFNVRETKVIENICSLWSNFAKTGNPTPGSKSNFKWRPTTATLPCYLRIDEDLTMVDGKLMDQGRVFWQNIIEEARSIQK